MDLKDLDRIHKEQAERQKFSNVLQRFEEWANFRNVLICVAIVVVLVVGTYGLKEMNFLFEASPVEETTEQPIQGETTE